MTQHVINIDDVWKVILIIDVDYDRYDLIESVLTDLLASTNIIEEIYDNIGYRYDSGFTYSNFYYRTSVVGINKHTSKEELINTIVHEIDHVQVDICNYYNINLSSEEAANIIGYLAENFYKYCFKLFCLY